MQLPQFNPKDFDASRLSPEQQLQLQRQYEELLRNHAFHLVVQVAKDVLEDLNQVEYLIAKGISLESAKVARDSLRGFASSIELIEQALSVDEGEES